MGAIILFSLLVLFVIVSLLVLFVIVKLGERIRLDNYIEENLDGLYCTECGAATYIKEHQISGGYDAKTGKYKAEYRIERHCPNEGHVTNRGGRADRHEEIQDMP